ncbi:MAG: hypothetical protein JWN72_2979 [Thermoleophilia bacterium]|nr:hypothetical protein [Thermoleophilia bacterium]
MDVRGFNVLAFAGGIAAGAVTGNLTARAINDPTRSILGTVGGGLGALGIGAGVAAASWRYALPGANGALALSGGMRGVNLLGTAAMGFGIGAAISGAVTAFATRHDGPKPTTPGSPAAPATGGALKALQSNEWVAANTTAQDRALLAAAATANDVSGEDAAGVVRDIATDVDVAPTFSSGDATRVAVAALEHRISGREAASDLVNVDAALVDGGATQLTLDIDDPAERAELAAAAIRGGTHGTEAAQMYGALRAAPDAGLGVHEAVDLAVAALESGSTKDQATAALAAVTAHEATSALPVGERVTLAAGALRGGSTGDVAATNYAQFASDEFASQVLASGDLTTEQAARVAAATTAVRTTGTDAALTFSNAVSDANVYDSASGYEDVVGLTIGAVHGLHTGAEAAQAYNDVAGAPGTKDLDVTARFELAGAALGGTKPTADVIAAYRAHAAGQADTTTAQDALLATGSAGAYDASADSEFADWYATAGR